MRLKAKNVPLGTVSELSPNYWPQDHWPTVPDPDFTNNTVFYCNHCEKRVPIGNLVVTLFTLEPYEPDIHYECPHCGAGALDLWANHDD